MRFASSRWGRIIGWIALLVWPALLPHPVNAVAGCIWYPVLGLSALFYFLSRTRVDTAERVGTRPAGDPNLSASPASLPWSEESDSQGIPVEASRGSRSRLGADRPPPIRARVARIRRPDVVTAGADAGDDSPAEAGRRPDSGPDCRGSGARRRRMTDRRAPVRLRGPSAAGRADTGSRPLGCRTHCSSGHLLFSTHALGVNGSTISPAEVRGP